MFLGGGDRFCFFFCLFLWEFENGEAWKMVRLGSWAVWGSWEAFVFFVFFQGGVRPGMPGSWEG